MLQAPHTDPSQLLGSVVSGIDLIHLSPLGWAPMRQWRYRERRMAFSEQLKLSLLLFVFLI
jgi:hypothetical protein